ncbi:MAG: competence/damage-inducible protein A [Clostridiales Family XIII bacterium]|jgi:nicotinamide-nucleotide amidase|nr:competence/damage-inducible protein A [Clostridiales Family XIII bacterium]
MNATILTVGTELLFGQIVNTNAAYLSSRLQLLGIDVLYHVTVGDNPHRLAAVLKRLLSETDLIVTTGGLGPTQDDLTKEIIAEVIGVGLEPDESVLSSIEGFFRKSGHEMTANNRKQALIPAGATVFRNEVGTAPGFAAERDGKTVIALPGPPREMKHLFEKEVSPYLQRRTNNVIRHRILRFYGIGESALESKLIPLIDGQTDPTVATYAKEGECSLRIASKRKTEEEALAAIDAMESRIKALVGEFLYSDEDKDLPIVAAEKLMARNLTLASAESCTGGLFADRLISVPGISKSFDRGYITYANGAKTQMLGVPEDVLASFGAVSEETAVAMAEGARKRAGTDVAISVTGVAGPDGGSDGKPVGLAWICVCDARGSRTKRIVTRDRGRNRNRYIFVLEMMNQLNRFLDREMM